MVSNALLAARELDGCALAGLVNGDDNASGIVRGDVRENVPEPGDPDRKRALNVLAQRRYRQRRREKIKTLEKKIQTISRAQEPVGTTSMVSGLQDDLVCDGAASASPNPWTSLGNEDLLGLFRVEQTDASLKDQAFIANSLICQDNTGAIMSSQCSAPQMLISAFQNHEELTPHTIDPRAQSHHYQQPQISFESELQTLETAQFTFPDDALIAVPELATMQAGLNIATLLGCAQTLWDPTCLRTLTLDMIPQPSHPIPTNLLPTTSQRLIPHHPLFDMLPWPSVRTRMICVFAQPVHLRPASAREPDALMRFMMDLDDCAEGVRVTGENYMDGDNWEVGEVVYRSWWWCLDRKIVENSNRLRKKRGAGRLSLGNVSTGFG